MSIRIVPTPYKNALIRLLFGISRLSSDRYSKRLLRDARMRNSELTVVESPVHSINFRLPNGWINSAQVQKSISLTS